MSIPPRVTHMPSAKLNVLVVMKVRLKPIAMSPYTAPAAIPPTTICKKKYMSHTLSCGALRAGLSGSPRVVDSDGSSSAFSVAAVLISAGPGDADGDGDVFDDISSGGFNGDNRDGTPN